ncbi:MULTISPECIES: galactose mutarotase [unclassified Cyanobium]|uniref:aldose epimerase family protein n=1 Tax=unclassified Cyanobium TaxID=2627006 RepID=UPI0020CD5138|nr:MULTISPECIES: galactose mutarotase [unclassified Cyanobium]MCP9860328.1 galactose mutarotase [Cyanobium sp. Cruz-8H5]MCP9867595.1 galactose mutarotase [Cyanobium sp. Cruz-8D1]
MTLQPPSGASRHWRFTDPASGDSLTVVPERGGLVTGWCCGGEEILYFDAERFADPAKSVRGGIPVLFPICGNLPGDELVLPQGSFPLAQHGFARDLPWSMAPLADGDGVVLRLDDGPESRSHFPFAFGLELELRLQPSALAITARISHRGAAGTAPLPFSLGLHPYVAVADLAHVRLEGLPESCFDHLTMAPAATAEQLSQLERGVDFLCTGEGPVRLVDPAGGRVVTLHPSAPMDLVVVWSDPPRPMLCLEPWSGPRGALSTGERRLLVPAGESLELGCRYSVETL